MPIIEEIKQRVSMRDICDHFGMQVNKQGFAHCVFHGNDRTPSLQIFLDEDGKHKGFRCFGCSANGRNAIDFYMQYYDIECKEALRRIDEDFNLNLLNTKRSKQEIEAAQAKQYHIRQKLLEIEREHQRLQSEYDAALTEYARLDKNLMHYAPDSDSPQPHPLFQEALRNIHAAKKKLNEAEAALIEWEQTPHNGKN